MPIKLNFLRMGMTAQDVAVRFLGIYQSQFDGLRQAGAHVSFSLDASDPDSDFIICTADAKDIQQAATQTHRPLILYVPPIDQWFDAPLIESLKSRILFAYGPCLTGMTADRYWHCGIAYHFLPFAADPAIMRPLNLTPVYDIAFLGGLQHRRGYQAFIEPLLKQLDPQKVACIGGGWQKKYNLPITNVGGLTSDSPGPPERLILTNRLYNSARVCINFSAPEQCRGPAIQLDCNNRLFDVAMAGCLQVSDNCAGVRMHFGPDEVFAESDPAAYVKCVLACLAAPDSEFAGMRATARAKAVAEHTWVHRGRTFLEWIAAHA